MNAKWRKTCRIKSFKTGAWLGARCHKAFYDGKDFTYDEYECKEQLRRFPPTYRYVLVSD